MRYSFDETLITHSDQAVEEVARHAVETTNRLARARRVNLPSTFVNCHIAQHGHSWHDGGGVSNSYSSRAETSVLGIAWWTDSSGRGHVRVVAGRVPALKSSFGNGPGSKTFGLSQTELDKVSPVVLVYPQLYIPSVPKKMTGLAAELLRAVFAEPTVSLNWMALADALEEGRVEVRNVVGVCREALTFLQGAKL